MTHVSWPGFGSAVDQFLAEKRKREDEPMGLDTATPDPPESPTADERAKAHKVERKRSEAAVHAIVACIDAIEKLESHSERERVLNTLATYYGLHDEP